MNQHTYSFPKVSPADPDELREALRATRLAMVADQPVDRRRDERVQTADGSARKH